MANQHVNTFGDYIHLLGLCLMTLSCIWLSYVYIFNNLPIQIIEIILYIVSLTLIWHANSIFSKFVQIWNLFFLVILSVATFLTSHRLKLEGGIGELFLINTIIYLIIGYHNKSTSIQFVASLWLNGFLQIATNEKFIELMHTFVFTEIVLYIGSLYLFCNKLSSGIFILTFGILQTYQRMYHNNNNADIGIFLVINMIIYAFSGIVLKSKLICNCACAFLFGIFIVWYQILYISIISIMILVVGCVFRMKGCRKIYIFMSQILLVGSIGFYGNLLYISSTSYTKANMYIYVFTNLIMLISCFYTMFSKYVIFDHILEVKCITCLSLILWILIKCYEIILWKISILPWITLCLGIFVFMLNKRWNYAIDIIRTIIIHCVRNEQMVVIGHEE